MNQAYKVYFAGPQVFNKEAESFFHYVTSVARVAGLVPLLPWTPEPPQPGKIWQRNLELLNSCDGAVACLTPFHGTVEPDSGTVWETGYLYAQGKPVVGYMNSHDKSYNTVAQRERKRWCDKGTVVGPEQVLMPDGNYVEDFGWSHNLMIQCSLAALVETLTEAMMQLDGELQKRAAIRASRAGESSN